MLFISQLEVLLVIKSVLSLVGDKTPRGVL
jgi:hypothetical protein